MNDTKLRKVFETLVGEWADLSRDGINGDYLGLKTYDAWRNGEMTEMIVDMPKPSSHWVDTENGYLYQYRGVCKKGVFKDRLEFKSFDYKTKTYSEGGGLYLGRQRFKDDMKPMEELAAHPCCGCPTLYPIVWCDDCGYEAWSAARDKKENAA